MTHPSLVVRSQSQIRRRDGVLGLTHPQDRTLVRAALRSLMKEGWIRDSRAEWLADFSHLTRQVACSQPRLVLVDPALIAGDSDGEAITRIAAIASAAPVLAVGNSGSLSLSEWLAVRDTGVQSVVLIDTVDPLEELTAALRSALTGQEMEEVLSCLGDFLPEWCCRLLRRAIPWAHRGLPDDGVPAMNPDSLASLWMRGAHAGQLHYILKKEGLPPAGWLIRWMILTRAVSEVERGSPTQGVAFALGFGSGKALDNYARRFSGTGIRKLTRSSMVDLFRDVLPPQADL